MVVSLGLSTYWCPSFKDNANVSPCSFYSPDNSCFGWEGLTLTWGPPQQICTWRFAHSGDSIDPIFITQHSLAQQTETATPLISFLPQPRLFCTSWPLYSGLRSSLGLQRYLLSPEGVWDCTNHRAKQGDKIVWTEREFQVRGRERSHFGPSNKGTVNILEGHRASSERIYSTFCIFLFLLFLIFFSVCITHLSLHFWAVIIIIILKKAQPYAYSLKSIPISWRSFNPFFT